MQETRFIRPEVIVALPMNCRLLIRGGKFAQLSDGGGDNSERKLDFPFGGVPAKAEAQAGASFFRRQPGGG